MRLTSAERRRRGITTVEGALVALVLIFGTMAFAYLSAVRTDSAELSTLQSEVGATPTQTTTNGGSGAAISETGLPIMNQTNTIREIRETWYLSPAAAQDRFDPSTIVVNQGDTIDLTLIDNDTVAHDFVIGPPYNMIVNATVPGLVNDITGQTFTTNALNNSPGVVVKGTPGNVSATYTFVAKYAGIFEFVCTYHAEIGMIGYLTVLPDSAYTGKSSSAGQQGGSSPKTTTVDMLQGSGANASIAKSYSPSPVTVVIGVNNTVMWVNNDSAPHTVTANDGSFGSGNIAPTGTYTYTFTTPGTYAVSLPLPPVDGRDSSREGRVMVTMKPKLRAEGAQPRTGAVTADDHEAAIARSIRVALEDYLDGRKLVVVKIRQVEGKNIEGFLKIDGGKGERLLVDFKATATPQGGLSSLEVGGRRIAVDDSATTKRIR